ncbi:OmpA family protein [Candidatus Dependentiae bacterium]|nr:OmpA family protein [Candidatus Dependentiae bacterium]
MKKALALFLFVLVALPGCFGKKKEKAVKKDSKKNVFSSVDIPTADGDMSAVFDDEMGDFIEVDESMAYDDMSDDELDLADVAYADDLAKNVKADSVEVDDFSWIQESQQQEFKAVYFDFDKFNIREDQEDTMAFNIEQAQRALVENPDAKITLIVEGHADSAAGSDAYNLALSEKRAKIVRDRFAAAGIPTDSIKIVGRGSEVPAVVDGKIVEGDRNQQWANRRDEMRIIIG